MFKVEILDVLLVILLLADITSDYNELIFDLLTLLSASKTDTLDCNVETLFFVVVLSVFKLEISKLLVLTFVCKFNIFVSLFVFLILFKPI